jgi:SSS family transporter
MPASPEASAGTLHLLDWAVLALYLLGIVALGVSFYKEQKTTKDFFLAGRSMTWVPVGLSVVATLFSAVSYMAIPSATQKYGVVLFAGSLVIFLCIPVVNRVFLPLYNRMQVYSAYEYLEHRFDVRVRCLASGIFIFWRICWMATAVYAPSLALWAATGGSINLYVTIGTLGLIATGYTALGGMKAVIWTDVIQFCVLFGGMLLAVSWIVFEVPGGLAGIFQTMAAAGKTSFVATLPEIHPEPGLFERIKAYFCVRDQVTLLAVLASSLVSHIAFYTVDQVVVQRYFTTRNLNQGQKSFRLNICANVTISLFLTFLGMSLFAYYSVFELPERIGDMSFQSDWKYPYFVSSALPAGVTGLLIAALYAATMSSVDSGINSCSTAFLVDFWQRLKHGRIRPLEDSGAIRSGSEQLVLARSLTLVLGIIVTILACFVGKVGDIIEIANKIVNSFCGPMFAIFLLGMLTKRARSLGVCLGALSAMLMMAWLVFGTQLNFLWPSSFGLAVALLVGYGVSLLEKPSPKEKLQWTLAEQRKIWRLSASKSDS